MNRRSSRSTVTFHHPFTLEDYAGELPAGDYEVVVDEELLQGLSFVAYRRTATYLMAKNSDHAGRTEMRQITEKELEMVLSRDRLSQ